MTIQIDFDNKEITLLDDVTYRELVNFLARIPNASEFSIRAADRNIVYIPYTPQYPVITSPSVRPWWEYYPTITYGGTSTGDAPLAECYNTTRA